MSSSENFAEIDCYSVSRLNREVSQLLQGSFPLLWVEGELTNLARPKSGHLYFTLKDEQAQVRCAMFRNRSMYMDFKPENGGQVRVRAKISLYEPRGDYQLIIEHMEEAGAGALQRAFDNLKKKLAQEGLFDAARKQALPPLPKCIGVITSPSGAAIKDILKVLGRRFPAIPVVIYPSAVQGKDAARELVQALATARKRQECDVLILARGGGSLEDLWPFNEEIVAREIAACDIPVITGVGHEIDFTIADFVADQRAPTPSAAAELATPDAGDWLKRLHNLHLRLGQLADTKLKHMALQLKGISQRLVHPQRKLQQHTQRLDELEQRLGQAWINHLQRHQTRLAHLHRHLLGQSPRMNIMARQKDLAYLRRRLDSAVSQRLQTSGQRLSALSQGLHTVSPLATLERGYAIVQNPVNKQVVRRADEVGIGDTVEARLAHGHLVCEVKATRSDS